MAQEPRKVVTLPEANRDPFVRELLAIAPETFVRKEQDGTLTTEASIATVARALDHMRNAGAEAREFYDEREGWLKRLGTSPLTYRLRSWQFDSNEQDERFWSYTSRYRKDDRLVTAAGEFKVVSVEQEPTPLEPGVLLVELWSDSEETHHPVGS